MMVDGQNVTPPTRVLRTIIRKARRNVNMSEEDVARQVGLSIDEYVAFESGTAEIEEAKVNHIIGTLEIDVLDQWIKLAHLWREPVQRERTRRKKDKLLARPVGDDLEEQRLTEKLSVIARSIEQTFHALGAKPGVDYTYMDVLRLSINIYTADLKRSLKPRNGSL